MKKKKKNSIFKKKIIIIQSESREKYYNNFKKCALNLQNEKYTCLPFWSLLLLLGFSGENKSFLNLEKVKK